MKLDSNCEKPVFKKAVYIILLMVLILLSVWLYAQRGYDAQTLHTRLRFDADDTLQAVLLFGMVTAISIVLWNIIRPVSNKKAMMIPVIVGIGIIAMKVYQFAPGAEGLPEQYMQDFILHTTAFMAVIVCMSSCILWLFNQNFALIKKWTYFAVEHCQWLKLRKKGTKRYLVLLIGLFWFSYCFFGTGGFSFVTIIGQNKLSLPHITDFVFGFYKLPFVLQQVTVLFVLLTAAFSIKKLMLSPSKLETALVPFVPCVCISIFRVNQFRQILRSIDTSGVSGQSILQTALQNFTTELYLLIAFSVILSILSWYGNHNTPIEGSQTA